MFGGQPRLRQSRHFGFGADPFQSDAIRAIQTRKIPETGYRETKEYGNTTKTRETTINTEMDIWLKNNHLFDQFKSSFDKYNIYTFEDLKNITKTKVINDPIDRNVVNHAIELFEATKQ